MTFFLYLKGGIAPCPPPPTFFASKRGYSSLPSPPLDLFLHLKGVWPLSPLKSATAKEFVLEHRPGGSKELKIKEKAEGASSRTVDLDDGAAVVIGDDLTGLAEQTVEKYANTPSGH